MSFYPPQGQNPYPGQPYSGQPYPGQPYPAQQPQPGQYSPAPNPYQPPMGMPQYGYPGGYMPGPMAGGLWRMGDVLVMHKSAQLPELCVKSGGKCAGRLKRNLQWVHPAVHWSILIGVLPYAILVAVLSKRATIYVGLSEQWFKKRHMAIAIGWLVGLGGVAMFLGSFALIEVVEWWGLVMMLGVILFFVGLCYGQYGARMVHPKKIDDQYVWLKGVHPEVLAKLPEWPYPV